MRHVTIVGQPRSGKTTLAKGLFDQCPHAIFINVAHEPYFEGYEKVKDENEAIARTLNGEKVVWDCDYWKVKAFISRLMTEQRNRETKLPITVFIDEAHIVCPRGSCKIEGDKEPDTFAMLLTNGLRWNIRGIFISQRPQLMDPNVYRLSEYKIFFRLDAMDISYLRTNRVSVSEDIENLVQYDWVFQD